MSSPVLTGFWQRWFLVFFFGAIFPSKLLVRLLYFSRSGHPSVGPGPSGLNLLGSPIRFWPLFAFFVLCILDRVFGLPCIMPVEQPRTVVIHVHGMVAAKSSNVMVQLLSKKLDFSKVKTIQFIPGSRIRVTFTSLEYRNVVLGRKTLQIDDVHFLNITASD